MLYYVSSCLVHVRSVGRRMAHDGPQSFNCAFQLLHPHLSTPVAHREEELGVEGVTLHRVHRAKVLAVATTIFRAKPGSNFHLGGSR